MVSHTMDVLSPFIPVLCHSDSLFLGDSCPCLDVVHPVMEEVDKGCSEFCVTVGTVTRIASILIHSRLKALTKGR